MKKWKVTLAPLALTAAMLAGAPIAAADAVSDFFKSNSIKLNVP